jgi:hypothetical protein
MGAISELLTAVAALVGSIAALISALRLPRLKKHHRAFTRDSRPAA